MIIVAIDDKKIFGAKVFENLGFSKRVLIKNVTS